MALTRKQKEEAINVLGDVLANSETVTFVNFHGLGVADTTELRSALRAQGVGYTVVKKTLAKRALTESKTAGELPELPGELAIAYGEETAPAREVYTFAQKHEGKLSLVGGIFEGRFLGRDEMVEMAQIPSLDVLRGMFVNLINSPIQRLAIVLDQVAQKKA